MTEPNPYAPPAVTFDTRASDAPLPPGVARFRLDPERFDRFQRIVLVQLLAMMVVGWGLAFAPIFYLSRKYPMVPWPTNYIALFAVLSFAWVIVARTVRVRMERKVNLDTYELLVSERAARRNLGGWTSAEILRPEVTSILEVPTGLWIRCTQPPRSLFVANAVDDYAHARRMFEAWAPIEPRRGFSAWTLGRREGRRQGPRSETYGTALAADPSLGLELETLRSASSTVEGSGTVLSRGAAFARLAVVWFVVVMTFLAVWQYLSPTFTK